jgi:hypothetical protein
MITLRRVYNQPSKIFPVGQTATTEGVTLVTPDREHAGQNAGLFSPEK